MKSFKSSSVLLLVALIFGANYAQAGNGRTRYTSPYLQEEKLTPMESLQKFGYRLLGGAAGGAIIGSLWAAYKASNMGQDEKVLKQIREQVTGNQTVTVNVYAIHCLSNADKGLLQKKIEAYNNALQSATLNGLAPAKQAVLTALNDVKPIDASTAIVKGFGFGAVLITGLNMLDAYLANSNS